MQNFIPNIYCYVSEFNLSDLSKLSNNINIIYRNYKDIDYFKNLSKLKLFCKKNNNKLYLTNDIKLSIKFGLDGVYLPAFNKDLRHLSYEKKISFFILGSAHNIKEIRLKEKQKVNLIFISSLFKKNKNYLGIYKFKNLMKRTNKRIIALGGISKINKKKTSLLNCYGFSGISFFE